MSTGISSHGSNMLHNKMATKRLVIKITKKKEQRSLANLIDIISQGNVKGDTRMDSLGKKTSIIIKLLYTATDKKSAEHV